VGGSFEVHLRSELRAPAAVVWQHASSMSGVNEELGPWVRMTHPGWATDLASVEVRAGEVAFRSWLLALRVLPFDRHSLALVEVHEHGERGGGFTEESTSWLQRRWRHERSVEAVEGGGCTVSDRLVVQPRTAPAALVRPVVSALFAHRHRRLARRFGAAGPSVRSGSEGDS
jgi:ligand-binding SRPBCC domain-containing protein